ncbi:uncharacterized protein [Nicotiana tomentosiformis]|uniref:uncharacterized protein n=1 Tax=Nicotiana tomentosiformis TaxID=4098 RepID=UPI00388CEA01
MVEKECLAYLDFVRDTSVKTHSVESEEHEQHLRIVLQILREKKLYAKFLKWFDESDESFQKLKTALTTALMVVLPTDLGSYTVYCDASCVGLAVVLIHDKGFEFEAAGVVGVVEVLSHHYLLSSGKANVVADALSMKAERVGSLPFIPTMERSLAMDVQALANRFVRLDTFEPSKVLACAVAQSSLFECIKARHYEDPHFLVLKDKILRGGAKEVVIGDAGVLKLQSQICVLNVDGFGS